MLRKPIKIGETKFPSKKSALTYYKKILNSYDFNEELNNEDSKDVLNLVELLPNLQDVVGVGIKKIIIGRTRYNAKSFELVRLDNSSIFFSYIKRINSPRTNFTRFSEACRQAIQEDLIAVKQNYFDKYSQKGQVKCQETGKLLKWEELSIDHRQPNTFSVIVDRFIEIKNIDLTKVKYIQITGEPNELANKKLKKEFIQYHKDKANLRIVSKYSNLGRSYQARIKRQNKDLRIE